jgi:hypothetical protein
MVIRKQTRQILELVIPTIYKTFEGLILTDNGNDSYTLTTCNTLWLTTGSVFTTDATEFTVTDLVPNESITFTGAIEPVTLDFDISEPFFWWGKMKSVNTELSMLTNASDKLPMIYLHQVNKERWNDDPEISLGMQSDVDLYFMCEADFKNFTIVDHETYCIIPMRNLVFAFIEALKNYSENIETMLYEYDVTDLPEWGSYADPYGNQKKYFNDDVSGCKLEINIPFSKENCCCENC